MVNSRTFLFISCLIVLGSARVTTPHELLESTFVYNAQNDFGQAFFRSFFGWQSVGAFNECLGAFLPFTGSFALLWLLLVLSTVADSDSEYGSPYDLIYQQFLGTILVAYRQQRCYFFSTITELTFVSSFLASNLPYIATFNTQVLQVASFIFGFFGLQIMILNLLSFVVDFADLLQNNQPLASLGYLTGDFLKYFMTWYQLMY